MKKMIFAVLLGFVFHALGQSVTPTQPTAPLANFYAAGVSYNQAGAPPVGGTAFWAHLLNGSAQSTTKTYTFTVVDALANGTKPFTMNTNIGTGIAQQVTAVNGVPIYVPTTAGISWSGSNTGWQWSTGVAAAIHLKGNWYAYPAARVAKSSVSNGTGYQPILTVMIGRGQ